MLKRRMCALSSTNGEKKIYFVNKLGLMNLKTSLIGNNVRCKIQEGINIIIIYYANSVFKF